MPRLTQIMNNFHEAEVGNYNIYFSYETPIGISVVKNDIIEVYVSTNEWSRTTGKHINWLIREREAKQIPHEDFMDIVQIEIG